MAVQTYIDGTEVTDVVLEGSTTRRLNRPSQSSVRIPIQYAIGDPGSRLKIVIDSEIFFHGMIMTISDEADENTGYSQYEATDPMELWNWRPARDHTGPTPGNLVTPTFFDRLIYGPLIMEEILLASVEPTLINPGPAIPSEAEGPLFLDLDASFFEGGSTANLSGAPTNFPMTIAEIASLLTSTGVVDIVITPTDPGGGVMGTVGVYNGQYGNNLTGSVSFDFATGNYNVRNVRQVMDMSNVCNKLQYFFTPKETLERYKANITGDDPWLHGNVCNPGSPPGPGGSFPGRVSEAGPNPLGNRRSDSMDVYGVRMDLQEFDVDIIHRESPYDDCTGPQDPARAIYRYLWQVESWLRAEPRHLVHLTPNRNEGVGAFDIGDLISVSAGTYLRGGFSGAQRIYEYTINWDVNGVEEVTELVTSPSQEGFSQ